MKKLILLIGFSFLTTLSHADIQDSLKFIGADESGNMIYKAADSDGDYDFVMIDGSKNFGKFASFSKSVIVKDGEAGYAIIPAHSFEEMSNNYEFAKTYTVECKSKIVIDNSIDKAIAPNNLDSLNKTASGLACSVLELTRH